MRYRLIMVCALVVALLVGCTTQTSPSKEAREAPLIAADQKPDAEQTEEPVKNRSTIHALIVDGAETGKLVLADEADTLAVYLLDASGISVTLDGETADASALEDGMIVDVVYDGDFTAALPSEISNAVSIAAFSCGTIQNPGGTTYDLCGLYLQVLDDLWDKDEGLNGGAKYTSVDLSTAPGCLNESAKYAVAWIFSQKHGTQPLTLTYDELAEQGYLTDDSPENAEWKAYHWEDGVLLSVTSDDWEDGEMYSLPIVKFSAQKWRSPLGAYMFGQCTAVWPEMGTWNSYNIGIEAIA